MLWVGTQGKDDLIKHTVLKPIGTTSRPEELETCQRDLPTYPRTIIHGKDRRRKCRTKENRKQLFLYLADGVRGGVAVA